MLRLRLTSDAHARWKNGQPHHSTTGVASTSWIQIEVRMGTRSNSAGKTWPPISSTNTGSASTRPIQNRRVMSASSGLGPLSRVTFIGSSAMPQIGQLPGPSWRTSGCIGQVQTAPSPAAGTAVSPAPA